MTYLDKLNIELDTARAEKSAVLQLCVELEGIENRLPSRQRTLQGLTKAVEKELKDVVKLESFSFAAFWQTIIGNKEKELEKEQEEYLDVLVQYEEIKKEVDYMLVRKKELSKAPIQHKAIKEQIARLLENKENTLISSNATVATALKKIGVSIEVQRDIVQYITIVLEQGRALETNLTQMLQMARNMPSKHTTTYGIDGEAYGFNYNYGHIMQRIVFELSQLQHKLNNYTDCIKKVEQLIKPKQRINTGHYKMYATYVTHDLEKNALQKTKGVYAVVKQTQKMMYTYLAEESKLLRKLERERIELIDKY